MMAAYELLIAGSGAAAIWILWFYFIREYRLDAFRDELFSLRDNLFNLAADGRIAFDCRSYIELRYLINGMLRFAHRVDLPSAILASRLAESCPNEPSTYSRWRESLKALPENESRDLTRLHNRMYFSFARHLISGSFTLQLFSIYVFIKLALRVVLRSFVGSRRVNLFLHRQVHEAVVNNVAKRVHAADLEKEAYRERDFPELKLA